MTTWDCGWADSQSLMTGWLADSPDWFAGHNRVFLVALFRRVRAKGGLHTLAEMLRAVSHRRDWEPWSEAIDALATGDGPEGCTSDEAKCLYEELSSPHEFGPAVLSEWPSPARRLGTERSSPRCQASRTDENAWYGCE